MDNLFWRIERRLIEYYQFNCALCRKRLAQWEQPLYIDRYGVVLHLRVICDVCKRCAEREGKERKNH